MERSDSLFLTFDDGPVPDTTPWILDLLEEQKVSATFFCVGENAVRFPELYQKILDQGHSVGNHTFHHLPGRKTDDTVFYNDIEMASRLIRSDLFRPPHGVMKFSQYALISRTFRIVMWDVLSLDHDPRTGPKEIIRNVTRFARPGSLVTFHDSGKSRENLMETLPVVIRHLKEEGYRFSSIPYQKRGPVDLTYQEKMTTLRKESA
jgi:peptidoglycan/xylan/chitin deacetylase (PgdA/CDA1 family)